MPDTSAPAGVSLTTALQTIYQHPSAAGTPNAVVRVRLVNIDGAADAIVNACNFIDASAANAKNPIVPPGFKIPKQDAMEFDKVVEPGDAIEASASAAQDIYATVDVYREPV